MARTTGLGAGKLRSTEWPHTEEDYLLNAMGYRIARKHAASAPSPNSAPSRVRFWRRRRRGKQRGAGQGGWPRRRRGAAARHLVRALVVLRRGQAHAAALFGRDAGGRPDPRGRAIVPDTDPTG